MAILDTSGNAHNVMCISGAAGDGIHTCVSRLCGACSDLPK